MRDLLTRPIYQKMTAAKLIFVSLLVVIIVLNLTPGFALALGLLFGLLIPNPYTRITTRLNKILLQVSVVGLGFAMDFNKVVEAGSDGFIFTTVSIIGTLTLGMLFGKLFGMDRVISYLVSAGTAICGGSAIAAISPVVRADNEQISVSIGIVFILNTVALFIFPPIGEYFQLTDQQFGLWSAIAIHDTSSVVGASSVFGGEDNTCLMIATTVKLARALWIVPLVLITAYFFNRKNDSPVKFQFPWFILFFIIASVLRTYVPAVEENSSNLLIVAKTGLAVCLYFIGTNLTLASMKKIGLNPFLLGILLWMIVSVVSFYVIRG